jgi:hypothetical protein
MDQGLGTLDQELTTRAVGAIAGEMASLSCGQPRPTFIALARPIVVLADDARIVCTIGLARQTSKEAHREEDHSLPAEVRIGCLQSAADRLVRQLLGAEATSICHPVLWPQLGAADSALH